MSAKAIIREVAGKYRIGEEELLGRCRELHLVSARSEIARRLKSQGLSVPCIGRLLKRDRTTVSNYLYPKMRASKKARHAAKRGVSVKIRPEYLPKLSKLAALTDASLEAAVNQAVSDMLEGV